MRGDAGFVVGFLVFDRSKLDLESPVFGVLVEGVETKVFGGRVAFEDLRFEFLVFAVGFSLLLKLGVGPEEGQILPHATEK